MTEEHKVILNRYWSTFKRFAGLKQEDKGWGELVGEMTQVFDDYKDTEYSKFVTNMFFAFLGEIERMSKKEGEA